MAAHTLDHTTAIGTVSGTILAVAANIQSSDITKTIILAIVGATISFITTQFLKKAWYAFKEWYKNVFSK